jgi:conjugative relaxase-like TrwC/TraI family protein
MVRFDKPCLLLHGAVEYFRGHLRVGDYLTEEGKAEMTWFGRGAERLGLSGMCELEAFRRLCQGKHPTTGEKLGVREKANRRLCYFGQISAPKDVSIAYLVGGDKRIARWWNEAVAETLREIESTVATRLRRAGANEDRLTGNMIAAIVTHDASRALDPQLHTHVCLMNLTFDETEGRWKSVQPSGFYRHPGYFREVCYNKLAERMLAAGYDLEPARNVGFHIKGFPPDLREKFSKRREEILRRARAAGVSSQAELQAITAASRARKTKATAAELRRGWSKEAGASLDAVRQVIASARHYVPPLPLASATDVLAAAEAHVFERRSVADERVLLREALAFGRGRVSLDAVKKGLHRRALAGALLRHGNLVGSPEGLACEREFVAWVDAQLNTCGPLAPPRPRDQVAPGQARVVNGILAAISRVVILQGDAGTGKTTCLRSIVAGIEQAGGRVFGCAPSTGAADVLQREATPDAATLQQLLVNESLQRQVRGRVLIVDEAGLISARQMRDLCRLAEANDNRLLLVGDTKQHSSVEAGDALRCLQQYAHAPVFRLTTIRRQKDPAYREAVALLAAGEARKAFDAFARLGAVHENRDARALLKQAADDYVRTVTAGQSCLVISPVWSEIHAFTDEVRTRLKARGAITGPERTVPTVFSLQWTRAQLRRADLCQPGDVITVHEQAGIPVRETYTVVSTDNRGLRVLDRDGETRYFSMGFRCGIDIDVGVVREIPVATGDRLLIRANLKSARLKNGELVEVAGFSEDGAIALNDGRAIPSDFRHYSHGYATTSHAAQGKTVDRGILLVADAGLAAANLKQAYVSNSRFRESQAIYTTDRMEARAAMARPGERQLAMELALDAARATARQAFLAQLYASGSLSGELMLRGWRTGPSISPEIPATGTHG